MMSTKKRVACSRSGTVKPMWSVPRNVGIAMWVSSCFGGEKNNVLRNLSRIGLALFVFSVIEH
jgi:hypothetical protein